MGSGVSSTTSVKSKHSEQRTNCGSEKDRALSSVSCSQKNNRKEVVDRHAQQVSDLLKQYKLARDTGRPF